MDYFIIFISAAIVNNIVLTYFLGICPFLGVSNKLSSAIGMGLAVTFVMTLTVTVTWPIYSFLLVKYDLHYLEYVVFIIVIASLVQLVEMFIRKGSPALYRALGIYLPLITTNCAILGVAILNIDENYNFLASIVNGFSAGIGFTLALVLMASVREKLEMADVPEALKGIPIAFIMAG